MFEPLIIFSCIFLLICSISVFLFAITYYNKFRINLIDNKHISYDGDIYEKKD